MTTVDVGDGVELSFEGTTGATVTVSWLDPDLVPVLDAVPVTENPAGSGRFPYTFLPTAPGLWQAVFTASGTITAVERYWIRALSTTGPPPLAVVGDVAELYGSLTPAQEGLVSALLRRASAMVRAAYPDLADRIAAGTLDADTAAHAVVNMVLRVISNPRGLRSETVGPFTRTYDTQKATGLLALTDAETAMLAPRRTNRSRARTIMLRPGLAPAPWSNTDVRRW